MNCRSFRGFDRFRLAVCLSALLGSALGVRCPAEVLGVDERLAAAERFVEASEKYLHHSKLRRGMRGYGLTVLVGVEPVRFEVEIISVMTKWGPHQDVILARLSKQNLEKTGIIAGMSGSPCYVRHEGRDKLIGAVAYGWFASKEPICGIQPITQMLAISGVVPIAKPPAPKTQPVTAPATEPATQAAAQEAAGWQMPPELLAVVLDPRKRDFSQLAVSARSSPRAAEATWQLAPLLTPLTVSGLSSRTRTRLADLVQSAGLIAVQAGGVASAEAKAAAGAKLVAGGAISVPLVTGDVDLSMIGTVTDVVDGRVLAFGHSFMADGELALPMGPGYVHAVMPGLLMSFKLSSTLKITGTLDRDERMGVAGQLGPPPQMIPMTVEIRWLDLPGEEAYTQRCVYNVAKHHFWTMVLAAMLTQDGVWAWRDPPELHTIRHSVEIDFGELGRYQTSNVTSQMNVLAVASDVSRPLFAMLHNSLGTPPPVKSITVKMQIERGSRKASILKLVLDGRVYRPGDTLTGKVIFRPHRKPRQELAIQFALPRDLPDGTYRLTACDFLNSTSAEKREMPHRYAPRTVEELLASLQRVVAGRANRLYLRMPIKRGGLALGTKELPDLPESKKLILKEAEKLDTRSFTRTLVRSVASEYVLGGTASAAFEVQDKPTETLIRQ